MSGEFYCEKCDVTFYLRWTPGTQDEDRDADDNGMNDSDELSPDYCPFCGGPSELT